MKIIAIFMPHKLSPQAFITFKRELQLMRKRMLHIHNIFTSQVGVDFHYRSLSRGRLSLPTVEVRFEHLTVETKCHLGRRALPTLINAIQNMIESILGAICIRLAKRTRLHILNNISGVIKPSSLTLLLGPPSSGKTTLLKALAGRLDPTLKVGGMVTYNGYKMEEFVVQKRSAYISQNNIHTPELTVRETFDFAARCHGVSNRYELLSELVKREKVAGISLSAKVDFIMKIFGLDGCANIIVGDMLRRGISGGQKKRLTTGSSLAYGTTLFIL